MGFDLWFDSNSFDEDGCLFESFLKNTEDSLVKKIEELSNQRIEILNEINNYEKLTGCDEKLNTLKLKLLEIERSLERKKSTYNNFFNNKENEK